VAQGEVIEIHGNRTEPGDKDERITISGKDITIKGSGKINAKADSDMILKGSKIGMN